MCGVKNGMSATPSRRVGRAPSPIKTLTLGEFGLSGGGAHPIFGRKALIPAEAGQLTRAAAAAGPQPPRRRKGRCDTDIGMRRRQGAAFTCASFVCSTRFSWAWRQQQATLVKWWPLSSLVNWHSRPLKHTLTVINTQVGTHQVGRGGL